MGTPTSGRLGIVTNPDGACTSISEMVCGTTTGPQSLCTLSKYAGFSAPYRMSNFLGYENFLISPDAIYDISSKGAECEITIYAPAPITYKFNGDSYVEEISHPTLCPTGAISRICICSNSGSAREIIISFTPSFGDERCVTISQYGDGEKI